MAQTVYTKMKETNFNEKWDGRPMAWRTTGALVVLFVLFLNVDLFWSL